jgi:hypothetical protein
LRATKDQLGGRGRSLAHTLCKCLGFIFFDLFSNVGRTGCRRGRTPERSLRQPFQGLARSSRTPFFGSCSRIARVDPPTSSSLAEEERLRSLLLSTAGARFPTLAAGPARSQIDIANCCAAVKFRSTVVFGSFPFRYLTRTGASRQGEELSDIRCVAGIACLFAELR